MPPPNVLSKMGFVCAARGLDGLPPPPLAEIAFAGRSNVGKSSLLNALSGNRARGTRSTIGIASVANRPGVTRTINVYANPLGAQLVDLPGYGFAFGAEEELARWQEAMRAYLARRGSPLRVLLLIDARQSLKQSDRDFLLWLDREARVPLHVVLSKCDLVQAEELAKRHTMLGDELKKLSLKYLKPPHHMVSSKTMGGIELLRATLSTTLPEAIIGKGRKRLQKEERSIPEEPKILERNDGDVPLDEVATPAARRFAEDLLARRAAERAAPPPSSPRRLRGAEAARERAGGGLAAREKQQAMARDYSRIRIAKRREQNRAARRGR